MSTTEKLLNMKKEIEEAELKLENQKGKHEALIARLNDEWGCSSIEEGDAKLEEMEAAVSKLQTEFDTHKKDLCEKYGWNL